MRKYYLVLLCCLRDRHQLQTSVKDNKQYPFFISVLLTVLDIITFALGLTMILNMFLSNSFFFFFFFRKVVAHVYYLRLTRSRSNPQWSSMLPSPFFALNRKPRGTQLNSEKCEVFVLFLLLGSLLNKHRRQYMRYSGYVMCNIKSEVNKS